jgi:Membrane domain of glycerophosphoryl diester phosphodiesterase
MTARTGRRVSPAGAVTAVLARGSALVVPAVLLAAGSAIVTLAIQLNSETLQRSDLTSSGGTSAAEAALSVAAIVIAIAIFYLSIRWGLAIAAILVEDIGLRAGLRRSSQLTHGHRLRLGAIVILVGILQALTVSLPAIVTGVVVGLNVGSLSSGIIAFAIAAIVGSALWAPFNPAVAAVVYGRLTERATNTGEGIPAG